MKVYICVILAAGELFTIAKVFNREDTARTWCDQRNARLIQFSSMRVKVIEREVE